MLNFKEKKKAVARMNEINSQLKEKGDKVVVRATNLYTKRHALKDHVNRLWEKINDFRNKPVDMKVKLEKVRVEYTRYEKLIEDVKVSSEELNVKAGTAMGGGIIAGAGVAALAPTVAMSIASTFGTASTGVAISALNGAAADGAALAWLGGGTLSAGGGGMAGGSALLALSGPAGWALAAVGIATGSALENSKNKKVTKKANDASQKLIAQMRIIDGTLKEIENLGERTIEATHNVRQFDNELSDYTRNYSHLTEEQQYRLGAIVNDALAYAELLNVTVGG
ncbi:hypothetical protein [Levilactobacillus huananensis]|uniref:hypothetical protein n=1 Tax=Levilactobacillus huananensis TaxID=2486019 RepID=UPI000F7B8716|nr:hypothetical protein [Levilactobacillus huananensis]